MEMATYWEDSSSIQNVKFEGSNDCSSRPCKEEQSIFRYCEGNLNFATAVTSEEEDYGFHKKKISRDPMSHRIIEKRRRDRMNNCLADLSRLIPADYLKKGRGRIEKTEIIEMAIKHMKHLQAHACRQSDTCELAHKQQNQEERGEQYSKRGPIVTEHYRLGYQECLSEAMHFLVEVEGFFAGDPLCVQLINHLQKHCDKILKGDRLNFPRVNNGETTSTSSGSSTSGCSMPLGASGMSTGSPGSGSSSDSSGRSENRDSGIGLPLPGNHGSLDENSYEDGIINLSSTSQLREMLTSPKLSAMSLPPEEKNQGSFILHHRLQHMAHSPASPAGLCTSGGAADQSGSSSSGSVASLYKFKNNIKQRFSAEHHDEGNENINDAATGHVSRSCETVVSRKRQRHGLEVNHDHEDSKNALTLNILRRSDSDTCSISPSPHSPSLPLGNKYPRIHSPLTEAPQSPPLPHRPLSTPSYGVPIFALDYKGSYYVPLTLDMEVLAPYFAPLGFGQDVGNSSNPMNVVLHPVTISVNFQQANQHRVMQALPQRQRHLNSGCTQVSSWKTESQDFMPKWPMCSADRG